MASIQASKFGHRKIASYFGGMESNLTYMADVTNLYHIGKTMIGVVFQNTIVFMPISPLE